MEKIQQPDSPSSKSNNSNCSAKINVSPSSLPNTLKPSYGRYCHIVKRPDFDGYGFNLHSEKIKSGQYIGKVDPDSPAEAAGLREGDQIIEVNGVNIGDEAHKQVVQRIKAISNEVRLLLIDPNTESVATNSKNQTTTIGAAEKNTNKTNNNSTNSKPTTPNSSTTAITTTPTIVPMIVEATVVPSENQKDEVTSISMVSRKSQSTYSNDPTVDVTDFNTSEETINNGHHATATTIANGKSSEIATPKVPSEVAQPQQPPTITTTPPPPSEQQMMDSSNNKSLMMSQADSDAQSQNKPGLNLNLTAAEMRAKLSAKKKFDPKNESVDLKKKFDIIQKL